MASNPKDRDVTVAASGGGAVIAGAALPTGRATVSDGGARAIAAQAGSGTVGDWAQNSAAPTPLDTRSFQDILGSFTQAGQTAAHAVTVRAVARIVPKARSTTRGTIDVICELVERTAGAVIDRVQVTAHPRERSTLVSTGVTILTPGGSVKWRCRQQRTSPTHLVRLEHGRLIDIVVGNGGKLGPIVS